MLRTLNCEDIPEFESTSTFPITAFPLYSVAISSIIGPIMRQGPHHSAQKSTITGWDDFRTNSSKFASVISTAILVYI